MSGWLESCRLDPMGKLNACNSSSPKLTIRFLPSSFSAVAYSALHPLAGRNGLQQHYEIYYDFSTVAKAAPL